QGYAFFAYPWNVHGSNSHPGRGGEDSSTPLRGAVLGVGRSPGVHKKRVPLAKFLPPLRGEFFFKGSSSRHCSTPRSTVGTRAAFWDISQGCAFFASPWNEYGSRFAPRTGCEESSTPLRGAVLGIGRSPGVRKKTRTPGYYPSTPPACAV